MKKNNSKTIKCSLFILFIIIFLINIIVNYIFYNDIQNMYHKENLFRKLQIETTDILNEYSEDLILLSKYELEQSIEKKYIDNTEHILPKEVEVNGVYQDIRDMLTKLNWKGYVYYDDNENKCVIWWKYENYQRIFLENSNVIFVICYAEDKEDILHPYLNNAKLLNLNNNLYIIDFNSVYIPYY